MNKQNRVRFAAWMVVVLSGIVLITCKGEPPKTDVQAPVTVAPPPQKKLEPVQEDPAWALKGKPVKVAFSTILISYKGALRAGSSITRTREQAQQLVDKVYAEVSKGMDFGAAAKKYSEGPESKRGGVVGVLMSNLLPDQMSTAILALEDGGISRPVETPFGYQLLRRDVIEEAYLAQIKIGFSKEKSPEGASRSVAEAKKLASEAYAAITGGKLTFAAAWEKYADPPKGNRNGLLGRIPRGVLPEALDKVAFNLKSGEISTPIEDTGNILILQRLPEITARHILITHQETAEKRLVNARSKEEAAALAATTLKEIMAGEDFQMLAMSRSDCPSRTNGGNLGEIADGVMPEAFDRAAFKLAVGATSEVVESEFGYHIIQRIK